MKIEIVSDASRCRHEWTSHSGFYVHVCVTSEEPNYYPPCGLIELEVCPKCGTIRLPSGAESWGGIRV